MQNKNKTEKTLFLIPLVILIDQITKYLFLNRIIIIKNFPLILFKKNTGIAFSFLQNQNFVITMINIIIIIILVYYYSRYKELHPGLSLLIAGAVSNTIDRLLHGFVIDFINIGIWPVFNLADLSATLGFILIILKLTKKS